MGEEGSTQQAIQDLIGGNHCWGCGPLNPHGLQIKSYWQGDAPGTDAGAEHGTGADLGWATCTFQPHAEHMAGPTHVVNGGILATVLDCHSVCTAIAAAYLAEGRPIGSAPGLWYATASLNVTYLRPTPIDEPCTLEARILSVEGRRTTLQTTLRAGGKECVRADVVAVRVPDEWSRRPA
jgi:acyl-coenzyme A thioesterase PaaI-like protein